jgi:hypothetical protein
MNLQTATDFTKWNRKLQLGIVVGTVATGSAVAMGLAPVDGALVGALVGVVVPNLNKMFKRKEKKEKVNYSVPQGGYKTFADLFPLGVGEFIGEKYKKNGSNNWTPTPEYRAFLTAQRAIAEQEGAI